MESIPASDQQQLHIFFFPFMSPGHQIRMLDLAKLAASRGVKSTVITTPLNLSRLRHGLSGDLPLHFLTVDFPSIAAGLPENCESLDSLPSRLSSYSFSRAVMMLCPQAEDLVRRHRPDAIISDVNLPWTAQVARKYDIPRIIFHGTCLFSLCVSDSVTRYRPYEGIDSDYELFLVPGLPEKVPIARSWMPSRFFRRLGLQDFSADFAEAERNTYGVVANTLFEIEPQYVDHYGKITGKKVWPVGPVSLCNEEGLTMADRGNRTSIEKGQCLSWLNSKEPNSVIYVCFGSLCVFAESQLVEIGLGLEASMCNFIWVVRDGTGDGVALGDLEERVKGRGLIIRGWAPQVLILNHPAVGGFVTHCGWNSVMEAVVAGVPMVTWPLFGEQFYNGSFVKRLRIGISIGSMDTGLIWGEEEDAGALVKRGRVAAAVARLMGGGGVVREIRERASRLSELARAAVRKGGSSYVNLDRLIEDLSNHKRVRMSNIGER